MLAIEAAFWIAEPFENNTDETNPPWVIFDEAIATKPTSGCSFRVSSPSGHIL
ncbi:hypothetical protein BDN72DRAFT_833000 [Pluteus cervinus]|uniref:Uncharacterized protein n=1 Tax=Pluteus cervinus TaxID=181527 RepID=A0ACD3BD19_9AGAR|nr:hypothetical protein BDN72DRAFT_833000 [Pluteus cervinus]